MAPASRYRRILLKLSGEGLMGRRDYGLDPAVLARLSVEVKAAIESGVQVAIVVGGGNIFRGISGAQIGVERATADYMGMLATVMNALALQGALERAGVEARPMSAIPMLPVCESYDRRRALRHLARGRVVVFAAGTGNPFFTTDTAAALRAIEMRCDALLKATQVDGVYTADPKKVKNARRYKRLAYDRVLAEGLAVMDTAAVALARDNGVPILVFSLHNPGNLARVLAGRGVFTVIDGGPAAGASRAGRTGALTQGRGQ